MLVRFKKALYPYWNRSRNRMLGNRTVRTFLGIRQLYCIGDSHVEAFEHLSNRKTFPKTRFDFTIVGGASALGMVNPNSRTQALNIFRSKLDQVDPTDYLLFLLGEVDCGFVIWIRAAKYQLSADEQLTQSLDNYLEFLLSVEQKGYSRIIVCSVPPPTILDGQDWGEVANARRDVTASLQERTAFTKRYNERLRACCNENGWDFLDFEKEVLDPVTGTIDHRFLNNDPLNHHLESTALSPILTSKLKNLGFR